MQVPNFNPFMLIIDKVIRVAKNFFSSVCASYIDLQKSLIKLSSNSNSKKKIQVFILDL